MRLANITDKREWISDHELGDISIEAQQPANATVDFT
jgi:hypothetical protein